MRGRGRPTPYNSHRQPAQHVSTKSWTTTTAANPDAPPEWLRCTYTRTIPKDLRTVEQLRLSFEDARQQWRSVCCKYESCASTSASKLGLLSAKNLPPGIRSAAEQVVSQVKAVKQELLAQLAHKLEDLKVSMGDSATTLAAAAASQTESGWVQDLVWSQRCSSSAVSALVHPPDPQRTAYLEALWLARRVWVWSICLACAAMDLELLSGSVSVASELFFGCLVTPSSGQQDHCSSASTNSQDCVCHSSYDLNGAVTDAEVRAANTSVKASAQATEVCKLRAFLGASCSGATRAVEEVVTDAFWVHTIALCYSAIVRDDASAARLLALFDQATALVAEEKPQDISEDDACCGRAVQGEEDLKEVDESQQQQQLIAFVRQMARLLLDEDYCALQSLLRSEGYELEGTAGSTWSETVHADPNADGIATSLATACPEGFLVVLLVRLLGEHVVRRRWTAENLGQAFRPIEPEQHLDASAAHPNRLVNALGGQPCGAAADDSTPVLECCNDTERGSCALRLCHALQVAALRDMGGDWPLPPLLLRATFGGL